MKKVIILMIFSLLLIGACNFDIGLNDDSDDSSEMPVKPQIDFDANGNAIAVWHNRKDGKYHIWTNRFSSSTWETAQKVMEDNIGDSINPKIAIDSSGNAIVLWEQKDFANINIWRNQYTVGIGWGTSELFETDDSGDAISPDIAIDSNDEAMVVWSHSDGESYNLYSNIYSGSSWGTPELVESNNSNNFTPNIKYYSPGNAIVVWKQKDESSESVYSNSYEGGTGWGAEKLISKPDLEKVIDPQIVIDPSGTVKAIALWWQYDEDIRDIYYNIWSSDSTWGTSSQVSNRASSGEYEPHIAIDPSGNAIAVWRDYDGEISLIKANRYDCSTGWGSPETISLGTNKKAYAPRIAIGSSGNALAVWQQEFNNSSKIFANKYDALSGWGSAEVISANDSKDSFLPTLAYEPSNDAFFVLWNYHENGSIWARRNVGGSWEDAVEISLNP